MEKLIFAEMRYPGGYADVHSDMVTLLESYFSDIESGLQGESWIWVLDGNATVAIDNFSSLKHQIKSYTSGPHVQRVIDTLRIKYDVHVFNVPFEEWG